MIRRILAAALLVVISAGGCATVNPKQDYERVSRQIETATGQSITVDPEGDAATRQRVSELLADGLTAQEAVQLAIEQSELQAGFLRIGIGRAAVVQSGLFSNPSLGAFILGFPTREAWPISACPSPRTSPSCGRFAPAFGPRSETWIRRS